MFHRLGDMMSIWILKSAGHKNTSYWLLMPEWADFLPSQDLQGDIFDKNFKSGFNL